ncbi:dephospho-CoA kinase [Flavobacterium restrictum]|uniref:Dephospho-CoA kinase n=1 Tax=Flavobacterium restrictum TaxID=2594428 RepID=A0A553EDB8_9FLAO|nr:dephospho-CoA kinase [Flavobacterium restrictum]TRX42995.1 dephospho-CoA kinase [Flavobacterium restrictum]
MTKIIGLTGGIGSGKTTVAHYFQELGIPIYIADDEARILMESKAVLNAIRTTFGDAAFDGFILNRQKLAAIVFNDAQKLAALNAIVHPAVRQHFEAWLLEHKEDSFVIYEAAILFESGNYKNCDCVITVTAPVEARILRVITRDNTTREAVLKRMTMQWSDAERIAKSDFVIQNTSLKTTKSKIVKILNFLKIKQN